MQLQRSGDLKFITHLKKKQETPFQGKPCEDERRKQVVQKHLFGQKQIGGESLLLEHQQKKCIEGKGPRSPQRKRCNKSWRCVHGTKGQCAKGDSCSLKQEPIKRPQSKGRCSIHHRPPGFQNEYKCDGKGKAPRISGASPSGNKDKPHASISKEDMTEWIVL